MRPSTQVVIRGLSWPSCYSIIVKTSGELGSKYNDKGCLAHHIYTHRGLVTTKPVFRVCDKVRFKPVCSDTETS